MASKGFVAVMVALPVLALAGGGAYAYTQLVQPATHKVTKKVNTATSKSSVKQATSQSKETSSATSASSVSSVSSAASSSSSRASWTNLNEIWYDENVVSRQKILQLGTSLNSIATQLGERMYAVNGGSTESFSVLDKRTNVTYTSDGSDARILATVNLAKNDGSDSWDYYFTADGQALVASTSQLHAWEVAPTQNTEIAALWQSILNN
jgi:hypothetical protein